MNHETHNPHEFRWGEVLIVPLIALAMTVGLFRLSPFAGLAGLVAMGFLGYHSYVREKETVDRAVRAIEELDMRFDEVTKNAVFSMPFPMAVLNGEGRFLWYNATFRDVFDIRETLLGKAHTEIFPELTVTQLRDKAETQFAIDVNDCNFHFYHNVTEARNDETLILLYGIDNTEDEEIRRRYLAEQTVIAVILFDNYEEVRKATPEQNRPILFALIDRKLSDFAAGYEASLVKYEPDRYLLVTTREWLDKMKQDKFPILESMRDVPHDASVRPTCSIGVGVGLSSPAEMLDEARQALDVALARGGDQAVIKSGEDIDYYGGKNQATQRYTKVKARVMSNTLRSFIEQADQVYICGHQNPDFDAFGASLGMLAFTEATGVPATIVLDSVPAAIENLYDRVVAELPEIREHIVFADAIRQPAGQGSLVIVLDNHRHDAVAAPLLLDGDARIIIIDHHRRGSGYIQNAEISYIEPSASSTSEMITELISYQEEEVALPKVIAEGLLAGITVDTKNFFYQTSTRTFEAAAYLKRRGADSMMIKEVFKDPWDLVRYRSEILANAAPFRPHIMIGRFEEEIPGATLIASQAADDLLGVRDIEASFVLARADGKTHISARSMGEISVQLIMEKLGGGGHLTAAATRLPDDMETAQHKLEDAIVAYLEEEEEDASHSAERR
ncbi:MAG: DHH family phosphoesterase [Peptoniphilaceae bacterium]|nr:DHH family phosphoesterase [Peptoniphilaceae bacterium]MDY6085758.1 DHH family phosphoesterase [Peptoniphilaceae bacterium]